MDTTPIKDSLRVTKYFIDNETSDFHLLALADVPKVAAEMKTCLRSWFLAYCVEWEDASSSFSELEIERIYYWHLDDMFSQIQFQGARALMDIKGYHKIFLYPIETFGNTDELLKFKNSVRDWFGAMLGDFDTRHDRVCMARHAYTYASINEYLEFFLAQRQEDIANQLAIA